MVFNTPWVSGKHCLKDTCKLSRWQSEGIDTFQVMWYWHKRNSPLRIKHGNWKITIYRWCFRSHLHLYRIFKYHILVITKVQFAQFHPKSQPACNSTRTGTTVPTCCMNRAQSAPRTVFHWSSTDPQPIKKQTLRRFKLFLKKVLPFQGQVLGSASHKSSGVWKYGQSLSISLL